jgi:hypothetical protein
VDWILPAQNTNHWQALLNTEIDLRFPENSDNFLTSQVTYELLKDNAGRSEKVLRKLQPSSVPSVASCLQGNAEVVCKFKVDASCFSYCPLYYNSPNHSLAAQVKSRNFVEIYLLSMFLLSRQRGSSVRDRLYST